MRFKEFITETFVNIIGFDDTAQANKEKYKDLVWQLIQKSYASIGGIKGSGFANPDDMVAKIPFWKIAMRAGKPVAVILYKDKGGRKSVAMGSDGSADANAFVNEIFKNEIYRSYGEKSKASLGKMMKTVPWEVLQNYVSTPQEADKTLGKYEITPITQVPKDQWPEDAQMTLARYPQLVDYGYLRDLNGVPTFKVLIGSPGKNVVPN